MLLMLLLLEEGKTICFVAPDIRKGLWKLPDMEVVVKTQTFSQEDFALSSCVPL